MGFTGHTHTPETKRKIALKVSRINKEAWANPDSGLRNRKDPWITRRAKGEVSRLLGKTYEEIYGEEGAKRRREIARDPNTWRGFNVSNEQRRIFSLMAWDTPEKARRNFEAQQRKPSKFEILLTERLNKEFPNTWKYVGDGQVWIAGKNPDFFCINGQKLLIEAYTPYFAQKGYGSVEAYIEKRKSCFLAYGFQTLFLNLCEKDWDLLIEQVKIFLGGK